jgi:hypothetical protein
LFAAVAGKGMFYYVSIASILLVLSFSANTAFADFPRLCRAIASNGYLPNSFVVRGRRLVFTSGILALAALTAALLIMFKGVTDRLIALYAVGAFLAFTMSQVGMVAHWRKRGGPGAVHSIFVNGLGALVTGITVLIVMVAKFTEGAWVTMLLIPGMLIVMGLVRRHYHHVALQVASPSPLVLSDLRAPIVVVPVEFWSKLSKKALQLGMTLSPEVLALHIHTGEDGDSLEERWTKLVAGPARKAGLNPPELVVLPSPYRFRITPIVQYVQDLEKKNPDRQIAVLIPELMERRWYQYILHRQRGELLAARLLFTGCQQIVIVNVPWYLGSGKTQSRHRRS